MNKLLFGFTPKEIRRFAVGTTGLTESNFFTPRLPVCSEGMQQYVILEKDETAQFNDVFDFYTKDELDKAVAFLDEGNIAYTSKRVGKAELTTLGLMPPNEPDADGRYTLVLNRFGGVELNETSGALPHHVYYNNAKSVAGLIESFQKQQIKYLSLGSLTMPDPILDAYGWNESFMLTNVARVCGIIDSFEIKPFDCNDEQHFVVLIKVAPHGVMRSVFNDAMNAGESLCIGMNCVWNKGVEYTYSSDSARLACRFVKAVLHPCSTVETLSHESDI